MRWDREMLPKPDLHVYSESGMKIMVYNMKRCPKRRGLKKYRERKFKKYNTKRKNSILLIILFWLSRG